jgi:hypothetical protein
MFELLSNWLLEFICHLGFDFCYLFKLVCDLYFDAWSF